MHIPGNNDRIKYQLPTCMGLPDIKEQNKPHVINSEVALDTIQNKKMSLSLAEGHFETGFLWIALSLCVATQSIDSPCIELRDPALPHECWDSSCAPSLLSLKTYSFQ